MASNLTASNPLKEHFWKNYYENFVNDPFYWYQPKGFAITRDNIKVIQKRLSVLKNFEGLNWSRSQNDYTSELSRLGLISLKKTRKNYQASDYSALARMNKVIFTTLGLAWVDPEDNVYITPVGNSFIKANKPYKVIEEQLLKYQIPNPSLRVNDSEVKIFPHLFLCELLLRFPDTGITKDEYILFISRAKSEAELPMICEQIKKYRQLSNEGKTRLISSLEKVPLIKEGRIESSGRRSSIYNTISLNSSYALDFFAFPDYLRWQGNKLIISKDNWSKVSDLVRNHLKRSYFIEFSNEKDWFSHYGDDRRSGSVLDALDYYEKTSNIYKAGQAYEYAKTSGLVGKEEMDIQAYVSLRVSERMLEDFLEVNLQLLEDGLTLVGRQYPTLIGPIDLLAQDKSKRFMVIELKKGRAADKVFGQLQRYRGFIRKEVSPSKLEVRGAIVAREIDRKLKYAFNAERSSLLQLFQFEFQGKVEEIKY